MAAIFNGAYGENRRQSVNMKMMVIRRRVANTNYGETMKMSVAKKREKLWRGVYVAASSSLSAATNENDNGVVI